MSKKTTSIVLFEQREVRRLWDAKADQWFFSIIDIIEILTGSTIPKRYWTDLKKKLRDEGFELYDKIVQLKFVAKDGKKYATDCADTETVLRLVQSIPSPKAEPFKLWLAEVETQIVQTEIEGKQKPTTFMVDFCNRVHLVTTLPSRAKLSFVIPI